MNLKRARELATGMREVAKRCIDLSIAEEATIVLDDRVTDLEALRDVLLAACKMALKRKPFPVGAMKAKEMLEDAVEKAEGKYGQE